MSKNQGVTAKPTPILDHHAVTYLVHITAVQRR
jgi:hypothetical protein